ncbi:MAG: ferritin-like domain-containing protein [Fibrobacter sp.]|nr:ferritin-like domain-containing protein [Fibrobacter sp.]
METNEMIDKLNSLIRLDNDALSSYNKVIEVIEEATLKAEITRFRDDHKRHVSVLSELVKSYGGEASTEQKDIRRLFLGGATALQSLFGVEGALKALHTGEKITNKNYSESVQWDVPEDVKTVLKENYADEQRHIRFVESALRDKVWEKR